MAGWNIQDPATPASISVKHALNFVWNLPGSVLVTDVDKARQLQEKIELALQFVPLNKQQRLQLIEKVADMVGITESNYILENIQNNAS